MSPRLTLDDEYRGTADFDHHSGGNILVLPTLSVTMAMFLKLPFDLIQLICSKVLPSHSFLRLTLMRMGPLLSGLAS